MERLYLKLISKIHKSVFTKLSATKRITQQTRAALKKRRKYSPNPIRSNHQFNGSPPSAQQKARNGRHEIRFSPGSFSSPWTYLWVLRCFMDRKTLRIALITSAIGSFYLSFSILFSCLSFVALFFNGCLQVGYTYIFFFLYFRPAPICFWEGRDFSSELCQLMCFVRCAV